MANRSGFLTIGKAARSRQSRELAHSLTLGLLGTPARGTSDMIRFRRAGPGLLRQRSVPSASGSCGQRQAARSVSMSMSMSRATSAAGASSLLRSDRWKQRGLSFSSTSTSTSTTASSSPSSPSLGSDYPEKQLASTGATLLSDYKQLFKVKLSALVVFTTSAGYLAAGGPVEIIPFVGSVAGTSLAACAASAFNQVVEVERDRKMKRTQHRPLPAGRIAPSQALASAAVAAAGSGCVLALMTNPVTTALGLGNIFLYAVPYTLSKTRTELNTWIGSVVGAIPPVMGWAAATGGDLCALEPALLGAYLYLWQFPHFFALSWMYRTDYARGGFQMVPCADPTGSRTAALITNYSVYLLPLPIIAAALDVTSWMFAVEGTALNAILLRHAFKFHENSSNENARKVFRASLWYLPASLMLLVYHSRRWAETEEDLDELLSKNALRAWAGDLRRKLRAACVHEIIAKEDHSSLCPAVAADGAVDAAQHLLASSAPVTGPR